MALESEMLKLIRPKHQNVIAKHFLLKNYPGEYIFSFTGT
jgi:hypothetical protein